MRQQSVKLDLGKRFKCGEVFLLNTDSFACAVECTLCKDRPTSSLQEFFDHIQVWHQKDWKEAETEKCETDRSNDEVATKNVAQTEFLKQLTVNIQPFEEVLIETSENLENKFEFIGEENHCGNDCSNDQASVPALTLIEKKTDLSVDDLAFDNLNIQCTEVATTDTRFQNDFEKWCRDQKLSSKIALSRSHSEDSGVDKSETSSLAASPMLSDESDHFQINEKNIKEQIHFGLNRPFPKPKLTTANMENLIKMYEKHPRLWQTTHDEHNNAQKCRESWQEIKQEWNKICGTDLSELDIRIRLSTLKQRYLKERERQKMYNENENFDPIKHKIPKRFRYYEKLRFLDEREIKPYSLQGAQMNDEYSRIIESYAHFPILWNKNCPIRKNPELRQEAYEAIRSALKLIGIHLPIETVRLRLATLKQRYRMAKIQNLKCRLKGRTFVSDFKHYDAMKYLDKHISPYVCDTCGTIFRLFNELQSHLIKENHEFIDNKKETFAVENAIGDKSGAKVIETVESNEKTSETSIDQTKVQMEKPTAESLSDKSLETFTSSTDQVLKEAAEKILTEDPVEPDKTLNEVQQLTCLRNAEILAYVNEDNSVTPLQWINEGSNNVPIFIMENSLQNQFEQNLVQSTELQQLILMNNENGYLNCEQVFLVDPQGIVLNPVMELSNPQETIKLNNFPTYDTKNPNKINFDSKNSPEKVYTNLENVFIEDTEILKNLQQHNILNIEENNLTIFKSPVEKAIAPKNIQEKYEHVEKLGLESLLREETATSSNQLTDGPTINSEIPLTTNNGTEVNTNNKLEDHLNLNKEFEHSEGKTLKIVPEEFVQTIAQTIEVESNCNSNSILVEETNFLANSSQSEIPLISSSLEVETTASNGENHPVLSSLNTSVGLNNQNQLKSIDEAPNSTPNKKGKRKPRIKISKKQVDKPITSVKKKTRNDQGRQTRSSSQALVANIKSDNFEFNVDITPKKPSKPAARKRKPYTLTRLTEPQGHKLIELYRLHPQLWNPEHPNFDSRRHKRATWRLLATQFNATFYLNYNWLQVHRKMMDYVKYYRREQRRTKANANVSKWQFFSKLKFLDEVNVSSTGLQKRMQQRNETLKIIEIYKEHPQLWDTENVEYTKRNQRQCTIALMCSRLQEVHNITIEPAKLRQCLLDLRYNFRTTKIARIEAEKRNEAFEPSSRFEYYDVLQFLEKHLPPFICEKCKIEFKCFSEYATHYKKEHKQQQKTQCPLLANDIDDNTLDNVCHICGIKFTLRQNLVQHLNRHYCERSLSCSTCDKKFFTKTSLDEHQRTHTKIPAVICPECGRTFVNTSKLTQHLKRHRNQRDYPCNYCDKAFYSAFERERHVLRHLNIRDKICPVCGKSFVAGSGYYTHIKLHNSRKEYSCTACNLEFSQHAGLYKHRKKYHP